MNEVEVSVSRGKTQEIDGELYLDANATYLMCQKALNDPEAPNLGKLGLKNSWIFYWKKVMLN